MALAIKSKSRHLLRCSLYSRKRTPHNGLRKDDWLDVQPELARTSVGPAYVPTVLPTVGCYRWFPWFSSKTLRRTASAGPMDVLTDFIWTSIYDKYPGSIKITTHLDHIRHCKAASGTNWSNRWTYRAFIINARCD